MLTFLCTEIYFSHKIISALKFRLWRFFHEYNKYHSKNREATICMKVGIDTSAAILEPTSELGIYTINLLRALSSSPINNLILRPFWPENEYVNTQPDPTDPIFNNVGRNISDYRFKEFIPKIIASEELTLYHDLASGRTLPEKSSCPMISTILSLAPCFYPEHFDSRFNVNFFTAFKGAITKASAFIVPRERTAQELIEFFHVSPAKVHVVPGAPHPMFNTTRNEESNLSSLLDTSSPYVLFAPISGSAVFHPKKLVQIWHRLLNKYDFPHKVVVIAERRYYKRLEPLITYYGLDKHFILTGSINLELQIQLYQNAALFLYPVKYDSLGLPLLNALAMGLPIIASDIPGLKGMIKSSHALIPLNDVDAWVETITKTLSNEEFKTLLAKESALAAKQFSWQETARKTVEVYDFVTSC